MPSAAIPEECSEIVQAPLLRHHPRLKNTVVTADAAHAQSATASLITTQGGDYLPTVKANPPGSQQAIRDYPAATLGGLARAPGRSKTGCTGGSTTSSWARTAAAPAAAKPPPTSPFWAKSPSTLSKSTPPFPGKKGAAMFIRSRQYVASIDPNYLAPLIQAPELTP